VVPIGTRTFTTILSLGLIRVVYGLLAVQGECQQGLRRSPGCKARLLAGCQLTVLEASRSSAVPEGVLPRDLAPGPDGMGASRFVAHARPSATLAAQYDPPSAPCLVSIPASKAARLTEVAAGPRVAPRRGSEAGQTATVAEPFALDRQRYVQVERFKGRHTVSTPPF
jgi:hypothetical protein